jgi:hypothetical protein
LLLHAALLADEMNHIGAADFQLMVFAQLNQLPQMHAWHGESPRHRSSGFQPLRLVELHGGWKLPLRNIFT